MCDRVNTRDDLCNNHKCKYFQNNHIQNCFYDRDFAERFCVFLNEPLKLFARFAVEQTRVGGRERVFSSFNAPPSYTHNQPSNKRRGARAQSILFATTKLVTRLNCRHPRRAARRRRRRQRRRRRRSPRSAWPPSAARCASRRRHRRHCDEYAARLAGGRANERLCAGERGVG